jgi:cytoskeletal protein RodZ
MEANQFESIPLADVYRRGFVKVYARYLRLDDEKAVADYNTHHSARAARRPIDALDGDEPDVVPVSVASAVPQMSRDTMIWISVGIGILGLIILMLFF